MYQFRKERNIRVNDMDNTTLDGDICFNNIGVVDHSHLAHNANRDRGTIESCDLSTILQVGGFDNAFDNVVFEDVSKSLLAETLGGGSDLGEGLVGWGKDGDIGEAIHGGSKAGRLKCRHEAGEASGSGSLGGGLQGWDLLGCHCHVAIIVWAMSEWRSLSSVNNKQLL